VCELVVLVWLLGVAVLAGVILGIGVDVNMSSLKEAIETLVGAICGSGGGGGWVGGMRQED
jgi:hypothetical protein